MGKTFFLIFSYEIKRSLQSGGRLWISPLFFIVCISLVPLGIAPESSILKSYSAGMIWIFALLSALLGLEDLFSTQLEEGSLDFYRLQPTPLSLIILARFSAHWVQTIIPLLCILPLASLMLFYPVEKIFTLGISLCLGSFIFSFMGGVCSLLLTGFEKKGAFLALLILPLLTPCLIFGIQASSITALPEITHQAFYLLLGLALLMAGICPLLGALALKNVLDQG
jgi:heme exporter protein B